MNDYEREEYTMSIVKLVKQIDELKHENRSLENRVTLYTIHDVYEATDTVTEEDILAYALTYADWWDHGRLTDIGKWYLTVIGGCIYFTAEGYETAVSDLSAL